jgi:hypothetical protein
LSLSLIKEEKYTPLVANGVFNFFPSLILFIFSFRV